MEEFYCVKNNFSPFSYNHCLIHYVTFNVYTIITLDWLRIKLYKVSNLNSKYEFWKLKKNEVLSLHLSLVKFFLKILLFFHVVHIGTTTHWCQTNIPNKIYFHSILGQVCSSIICHNARTKRIKSANHIFKV